MSHAAKWARAERARIERERPHQVALPADMCSLENLPVLQDFCRDRFSEHTPTKRVEAVWPDRKQESYLLWCFTIREHAEIFA
jgi:hypothetical protein